jgi:hypothetical protein
MPDLNNSDYVTWQDISDDIAECYRVKRQRYEMWKKLVANFPLELEPNEPYRLTEHLTRGREILYGWQDEISAFHQDNNPGIL